MARTPKGSTKKEKAPKEGERKSERIKEDTSKKTEKVEKVKEKKAKEPKKAKETKKKTTTKKTTTTTKAPKKVHPPYISMAKKAIRSQGDKEGHTLVSFQAILKYIQANYSVSEQARRYLKIAVNKGVDEKVLVQSRASFRLSKSKKGKSKSRSRSKSPAKKESPKKTKRESRSKSPAKKESKRKRQSATSEPKEQKKPKSNSRSKKSENSTKETSKKSKSALNVHIPGSKFNHHWQYSDGTWKNYDLAASDTVEEVYQGYLAKRGDTDVRAVKSGQWEYMVDFAGMSQTNITHENHTIRKIRRVANISEKEKEIVEKEIEKS